MKKLLLSLLVLGMISVGAINVKHVDAKAESKEKETVATSVSNAGKTVTKSAETIKNLVVK